MHFDSILGCFIHKPNHGALKGSLPKVPVFFVATVHWALKCRLRLKVDFQEVLEESDCGAGCVQITKQNLQVHRELRLVP